MIAYGEDKIAVIVDPGMSNPSECSRVADFVSANGLQLKAILLTHGHFDHIYGVKWCVDSYGVPVYMNPADSVIVENAPKHASAFGLDEPQIDFSTKDIADGDILSFGEMSFEVVSTPGHTPGGVCYIDKGNSFMFSGDTLFAGTIGRSDLPGGDYDSLILSLMNKLMFLDGDMEVFPGHGGNTTIGDERTQNPFLQPFNEKDPETGSVDGISYLED